MAPNANPFPIYQCFPALNLSFTFSLCKFAKIAKTLFQGSRTFSHLSNCVYLLLGKNNASMFSKTSALSAVKNNPTHRSRS